MMRRLNNIKLISSIAFTQLRAKKTQTIIATAVVAFGITVFIFLLSCVKGVNEYISELSLELCPEKGQTLLMVTHDKDFARHSDYMIPGLTSK